MAKSKTNSKRKDKVEAFKDSQTPQGKGNSQEPSILKNPNIRQFPVWAANDKIEVYGREWEEIFNFINGVQGAFAAAASVMNRNILDGKIKMRFEKLGAEGFVPMTPEEENPYQQEFGKLIAQAKQIADQAIKQMQQEPPSQEGLPNLNDIVDANGNPYPKEEQVGKTETPKLTVVRD